MLVAGGYDPRALATIDWLASRHDVPVSAYSVAMVRFGGERLLSVRREPGDETDPGSEVDWLLSGATPRRRTEEEYVESTPPPPSTRDREYGGSLAIVAGPARIRRIRGDLY